jgi:hypothetical protein
LFNLLITFLFLMRLFDLDAGVLEVLQATLF